MEARMCFEFLHGLADISILSRAVPNNHVNLSKHILDSMNYFDSDMSNSTNTVVYLDWKTVNYTCVCGQCRTQFMLPNSSRR